MNFKTFEQINLNYVNIKYESTSFKTYENLFLEKIFQSFEKKDGT